MKQKKIEFWFSMLEGRVIGTLYRPDGSTRPAEEAEILLFLKRKLTKKQLVKLLRGENVRVKYAI